MQQIKIAIPEPARRKSNGWMSKMFNMFSKYPPIEINNCNFFAGVATPQNTKFVGNIDMYADNQGDWADIWRQLGIKAPGKLPKGCGAQLMFHPRRGYRTEFALQSMVLDAKTQELHLDWRIKYIETADKKIHQDFIVVLVPRAVGGLSHSYQYETVAKPSPTPAP